MTTVNMIDTYKKEISAMVQEQAAQNIMNYSASASETQPSAEDTVPEELPAEEMSDDTEIEEAMKEMEDIPISEESQEELENVDNKDMILEMHKAGLSILEIARHLGLGVGEVKLVVDLYQGESK